jgi:hypothetical protein
MPISMKGWWKKWFYLRNDASVPLPAFTGAHPFPLPSWGDGVSAKDLQQLWHGGLTGAHLLRTFFSHRIQPLR